MPEGLSNFVASPSSLPRRDPKTGKFTMEKVPVYHIVDEKEKKKAS